MAHKNFDCITIGDSTLDTFLILDETETRSHVRKKQRMLCLNYADKIYIKHTVQSVGGNAANVAAGLAKLGRKTAIVTELGDDINGHIVKEELCRAGVHADFIKQISGANTRYAIVLNYASERTILSCFAKRSYRLPALPETQWIYYTSLGASFEKLQKQLIAHLTAHTGIRLAINPGSYQLSKGRDAIRAILPRTDILFVNREEAALIIGAKKRIKGTLRALHALGVKIAVITDSDRGSYASEQRGAYFMPAYPITPIAKTGAGDAYASGFLGALIRRAHLPSAMLWGSANAACVIREFGAQKGLCGENRIRATIKKFPKVRPTPLW